MTVSNDFLPSATQPLHSLSRFSALAAACMALCACSSFNNTASTLGGLITPYKVDVVQGNFVSKEQKDALQIGMPRLQVREVLGTPLVTSAFHADRWEYVFTILRQGQAPQQRKLSVFFKNDELIKVESDELITEEAFVTSLSQGRSLGKVPLLEVPPEVLREFGLKNSAPDSSSALANTAQRAASNAAPIIYPPLESPGAATSAWDASTQRAVAASSAARPAAPIAASNAPLLTAQAPANSAAAQAPRPAAASATPALTPPAPATTALPAPAPIVAPTPAPAAVAPVAVVTPRAAPAPIATPIAAPIAAPTPAPVVAPAPVPTAPIAQTPAPTPPAASASPSPAARAAVAPPAVAAAPVAPPAPVSSANTLATADPEITTFLNRWTLDWQTRNTAAYFSHYFPDFKGTSASRAEWEALRRTRIEGRTRISIAALDVRVRTVSPTEARLVFRQVYESDVYTEIGTKAMFLIKRDGRWLIEREFFTPAQ